MAPKQATLPGGTSGLIVLEKSSNFEQALEDLSGFSKIWVIYWFHKNSHWKPKVMTPRGSKRGVFATRSPHRPNPIGLSCVDLLKVDGRTIHIGQSDLVDGTPILDIKPYLAYADAFVDSRHGWIEAEPDEHYDVGWSELAGRQALFVDSQFPQFSSTVELRLSSNPFPFPSHRIKEVSANHYELSLKTWRVTYEVKNYQVIIQKVDSGYDAETLSGVKPSRWDDVPFHVQFCLMFPVVL